MYGEQYWYGKEVEGRYSDIETVFIRSGIPDDILEYPHAYFTIEYVREMIKKNDWSIVHMVLKTRQIVTVEATADTLDHIPMSVFNRAHIIYRIPDSHLAKLKKTDTLSIDAGWYRVHQIMKCNLMEINPDDYKFDRLK